MSSYFTAIALVSNFKVEQSEGTCTMYHRWWTDGQSRRVCSNTI